MGVMEPLLIEQPPMILTPCPVTLEGQQYLPCELREGETLGQFLDRTVDLGADAWEVKIGGVVVPVEMWDRVKPKHGHLIEVRGAVNKQALYIVAMIALTYFTFGIGTAAGWGAGAAAGAFGGGLAGAVFAGAVFAAGALVINKVLGPKVEQPSSRDRDSVYNIAGARNAIRPYEPLGLLLGSTLIAPDILSQPYTYYEGNDQYLAMVLTPGINVDRFDTLYFGDTPLSDYEGVTVWTAGFPGMPDQDIPLYSNADTIAGGELSSSAWVNRTTSPDTVGIMVNLEYMLGGTGTSGKSYWVSERVEIEYRPVGTETWQTLQSRTYRGDQIDDPKRATIFTPVERGQYDVRVRIAGIGNYTGDNAHVNRFQWTTLTSVQADDADYRGIPRIGIKIKATGQLNGTPDQIRGVFHGGDMPIWNGTSWGTATSRLTGLSNPGALILAYARGFRDENGDLIAGMGLSDGDIDIPALQAFMSHCTANGYTYDHWQQGVRSHQEVLDSIALAGFGQVSWAPGKLTVMWAGQSQPLTGVVNMATMKRGQFQVDYNLVGGADGVEYTYFDRSDWATKTLRVPAPGVETMLNPARLTGEGITTEAHAAKLARYHLAQSLYQHKDISYSTDLEHLTYRRMSMLALQHDLTRWGHGGRLRGASEVGGQVSLALDEPVPAPASGDAYIGLRVPSEGVYRVFKVAPFTGETDALTLVEPWPADVPLPGSSEGNPAHDTVWIYDFKSTPGYRVRVVSIEPEAGLKGARVAVVPEPPEFWTYVNTGEYQPPVTVPPSHSRPVASNLVIGERQVIQGNTEFTELTATFDVDGHVRNSVVYAALVGQPLEEVAQTTTRSARWRIDEPGEYSIVVRPYDEDGKVGGAVSATYITARANTPPPVFDIFEVHELSGGVRKYVWGYYSSTMQAANLAGAEIRYLEGEHGAPTWSEMTPLGDGFFTAGFEMVLPPSGVWTFAIRARNTSGTLSVGQKVIFKTLGNNIGEALDSITQGQADLQQAIDQEIYDRLQGDLALATDISAIQAQVSEIIGAEEWSDTETYQTGDIVKYQGKLYRAKSAVPVGTVPTNTTYWQLIGEFASLGEAVAAAISMSTQNASDIEAESNRVDALVARMPSGSGRLATEAMVVAEQTARANADSALASDLSAVQVTLGDQQATVSQLAQVTGAIHAAVVQDPSFELRDGSWTLGANMSYFASGQARTGVWMLDCYPSASTEVAINRGRFRVEKDQVIRVWGWARYSGAPPSNGQNSLGVRFYREDGSFISYLTAVVMSASSLTTSVQRYMGTVTVPAGAATAAIHVLSSHSAPSNARVQVDDVGAEFVTEGESRFLASYTLALNVNGHVSGLVAQNDGTTSVFSIMSDVFRVVGGAAEGMEWRDGYLRVYGSGYQSIMGYNFGSPGDGLVRWFGPNIGAANCTKANGVIWEAKDGSAYFGGDVLQGVNRAFNSNTTVSNTATVATGVINSRNRTVAVRGEVDYQRVQNYTGGSSVITLTTGSTGVDVHLERRYRNAGDTGWESWVTLTTRRVIGGDEVFNEAGAQSTLTQTIRGSVAATDVASPRRREYRTRLSNMTLRNHTVTNPGTTPAAVVNQYQSIESME